MNILAQCEFVIAKVWLGVWEKNTGAIRFYKEIKIWPEDKPDNADKQSPGAGKRDKDAPGDSDADKSKKQDAGQKDKSPADGSDKSQ